MKKENKILPGYLHDRRAEAAIAEAMRVVAESKDMATKRQAVAASKDMATKRIVSDAVDSAIHQYETKNVHYYGYSPGKAAALAEEAKRLAEEAKIASERLATEKARYKYSLAHKAPVERLLDETKNLSSLMSKNNHSAGPLVIPDYKRLASAKAATSSFGATSEVHSRNPNNRPLKTAYADRDHYVPDVRDAEMHSRSPNNRPLKTAYADCDHYVPDVRDAEETGRAPFGSDSRNDSRPKHKESANSSTPDKRDAIETPQISSGSNRPNPRSKKPADSKYFIPDVRDVKGTPRRYYTTNNMCERRQLEPSMSCSFDPPAHLRRSQQAVDHTQKTRNAKQPPAHAKTSKRAPARASDSDPPGPFEQYFVPNDPPSQFPTVIKEYQEDVPKEQNKSEAGLVTSRRVQFANTVSEYPDPFSGAPQDLASSQVVNAKVRDEANHDSATSKAARVRRQKPKKQDKSTISSVLNKFDKLCGVDDETLERLRLENGKSEYLQNDAINSAILTNMRRANLYRRAVKPRTKKNKEDPAGECMGNQSNVKNPAYQDLSNDVPNIIPHGRWDCEIDDELTRDSGIMPQQKMHYDQQYYQQYDQYEKWASQDAGAVAHQMPYDQWDDPYYDYRDDPHNYDPYYDPRAKSDLLDVVFSHFAPKVDDAQLMSAISLEERQNAPPIEPDGSCAGDNGRNIIPQRSHGDNAQYEKWILQDTGAVAHQVPYDQWDDPYYDYRDDPYYYDAIVPEPRKLDWNVTFLDLLFGNCAPRISEAQLASGLSLEEDQAELYQLRKLSREKHEMSQKDKTAVFQLHKLSRDDEVVIHTGEGGGETFQDRFDKVCGIDDEALQKAWKEEALKDLASRKGDYIVSPDYKNPHSINPRNDLTVQAIPETNSTNFCSNELGGFRNPISIGAIVATQQEQKEQKEQTGDFLDKIFSPFAPDIEESQLQKTISLEEVQTCQPDSPQNKVINQIKRHVGQPGDFAGPIPDQFDKACGIDDKALQWAGKKQAIREKYLKDNYATPGVIDCGGGVESVQGRCDKDCGIDDEALHRTWIEQALKGDNGSRQGEALDQSDYREMMHQLHRHRLPVQSCSENDDGNDGETTIEERFQTACRQAEESMLRAWEEEQDLQDIIFRADGYISSGGRIEKC